MAETIPVRIRRRRDPGRAAPSQLLVGDLVSESLAGILQRPGRSVLTMLGTVLGIGTFVVVLGLSETANGQISKDFNRLLATQVTVIDTGAANATAATLDFPQDAGAVAERINGVIAAGVWWQVLLGNTAAQVSNLPGDNGSAGLDLPVYAADPGALQASQPSLSDGVLFNGFDEAQRQPVAVLSAAAAAQLGIPSAASQPTVFIQGQPFTVVGIISSDSRLPQLGLGVVVPESTALADFGLPQPAQPAQMIIRTRIGAAQVVARQAAVAIRPDDPGLLSATAPVSPTTLRNAVAAGLRTLLLSLAAVAVIVGALGIANTSLVAIMERTSEIGLRRALGARPGHIAVQFLSESAALGLGGGVIGTGAGVVITLAVTVSEHWTAILEPAVVLLALPVGAVVGLLAGLYPALRASSIEPAEALRR
ncbi:MAG: ABC transporter permease [Streptosporangiaceae bacterium]